MMANKIIALSDFGIVCRICLEKRENMISIFKNQLTSDLKSYSEMLEECATVHVSRDDSLPKNLCIECSKYLEQSYKLNVQCRLSEKRLRALIENTQTEIKLETQITFEENNSNNNVDLDFCDTINDFSNNLCNSNEIIVKEESVIKIEILDNKLDISSSGANKYKCEYCSAEFSNETEFNNHNKTFHQQFIKCPFCKRIFKCSTILKVHCSGQNHCKVCMKGFECRNLLIQHNKHHRTCEICSKIFRSVSACIKHMQIHTGEKRCINLNFGKSFTNDKNLQENILPTTDEETHHCNICDAKFKYHSALKTHLNIHSKKTTYTCEICNVSYMRRTTLKDHMNIHTDKEFICEICDKRFKTKSNFKQHTLIHMYARRFLCSYCGKTFTDNRNFLSHIRIHTNDKRYHCKLCDKKFRTSTLLKFHLTTHSNEKKFTCKICNASYKRQNTLKSHMDNHSEEQFACETCGKLFGTKTSRRRHRKIHTGIRKHICSYCNKPFLKTDALKMHLRIHTGEKPFDCSICGRKFAQKHVLNSHLKTHDKN